MSTWGPDPEDVMAEWRGVTHRPTNDEEWLAVFRKAQRRKLMRLVAEAMPDRFRFVGEQLVPVTDALN